MSQPASVTCYLCIGDLLSLLHATSCAMHILYSCPLHSSVLAVDTTEGLGQSVRDCPSITSLHIWAPAAPAQPGLSHPGLDNATTTDWVRTAIIPPGPDDPDLWHHATRTATLANPKYACLEYQPTLAVMSLNIWALGSSSPTWLIPTLRGRCRNHRLGAHRHHTPMS
jgi:hypothetical protein